MKSGRKPGNNPDMEKKGKDEMIIGKEDIPDDHILMSGKQKAKTIK